MLFEKCQVNVRILTYFGLVVNVILPPPERSEEDSEGNSPYLSHVGITLLHLQNGPNEVP